MPLESNLREILSAESLDIQALLEVIPNVNHDQLVDLALYLAFMVSENEKEVWRAIEDACVASLHLMSTKQICQLEWASMQQKPKMTTARFNTLLMKHALESTDKCNSQDLIHIMQGFRQK